MKRLLIGVLLGGAIGAGVATMQGGNGDEDSLVDGAAVASGAASGAFFDRCSPAGPTAARRRGRCRSRWRTPSRSATSRLEAAEQAVEAARPLVEQAADAVGPIVDEAQRRIAA